MFFYTSKNADVLKKISDIKKRSINILFYPILENGFSTQMIINYIKENYQYLKSKEELDLLIQQFISLTFNVGILDSLNHFIPELESQKHKITNKIKDFSPIFISSRDNLTIKEFCSNQTRSISLLLEAFEIELTKRKRYIKEVEIFALNSDNLATKVKTNLKKHYQKINIKITTVNNWPFPGKTGLIITLI